MRPAERRRRRKIRARAPREPRAAAAAYVRGLLSVTDAIHAQTRKILGPVLERELPSAGRTPTGLTSAPDDPDAVLGPMTRADACQVCGDGAPEWYVRAHCTDPSPRATAMRLDAFLDSPFAVALGDLIVAIERITSSAVLSPIVDAHGRRIGEHNRREMQRVLGIDLGDDRTGLGGFMSSFRATNTRLVKSIPAAELAKLENILATASREGWRVESVWSEIERVFSVSRGRAKLIARDQTLKANADVGQLRQQNAGISGYFWICSRDERVRGRPGGVWERSDSNHFRLDNGERYEWTLAPITNPKKGIRNHPGKDYLCRCIAAPDVEALLGD